MKHRTRCYKCGKFCPRDEQAEFWGIFDSLCSQHAEQAYARFLDRYYS